jgi:hypothetical protein
MDQHFQRAANWARANDGKENGKLKAALFPYFGNLPEVTVEVKDNNGRINYPDFQTRIYKNISDIKWEGKVHERVVGFKTYSSLPINQDWDLLHIKSLERQEKQNNYYNTL